MSNLQTSSDVSSGRRPDRGHQQRIDAFAAATEDPQWIHVDLARAAAGPLGTTIAHGFLTLSLCIPMLEEVLPAGGSMAVNYGTNRVRFPAPVPSGSRIRGRFRVLAVDDVDLGRRATVEATVELEGADKPARRRARRPDSLLTPSSGSVGDVCYLGPPVAVKRLASMAVLVALCACAAFVPGASAGDFADAPCFDASGPDTATSLERPGLRTRSRSCRRREQAVARHRRRSGGYRAAPSRPV